MSHFHVLITIDIQGDKVKVWPSWLVLFFDFVLA